MSFAVLFVCTGNICRSPMAERLFRARLDPAVPVRTFGAGTDGLDGWPMDAPSARVLRELGGDPDGHAAQRITRAHIRSADLVLTAQRAHGAEIVLIDPGAASRTFTLREFGRLGAQLAADGSNRPAAGPTPTVDDLRARVAAVAAVRQTQPPLPLAEVDIGDPYGAKLVQVRACGEQIDRAVDDVVAALGLGRPGLRTPGGPPSPGPPLARTRGVTGYVADYAWLPTGLAADVRIEVAAGRIVAVTVGAQPAAGDHHLTGLTLPGFANTHSHAFHRALRGRTHDHGGTFWTWRERMYQVAGRLDPDRYLALARAVYAEMALAGVSAVGEFHYLHHAPGGASYADPNAMGEALIQAAADAGIRITLLDACYLAGGLGPDGSRPLSEQQQRFGDGTARAWAERVAALPDRPHARVGRAIHSVRAVPRAELGDVVAAAAGRPLHVHLSEQPAENDQCRAAYGCTPTRLLRDAGALGRRTTAVHATHLTAADIRDLGRSGTTISMCPTTERDLADGIGPARRLSHAGAPITLGSDQHAVIDPLEEARALELDERLASGERGRFTVAELVAALTSDGHASLGWDDAGRLEPGARADLTMLRLDTVRTAGAEPAQAMLAATAADVDTVIVDGRVVVERGRHRLGDVGRLLAEAIDPLWTSA